MEGLCKIQSMVETGAVMKVVKHLSSVPLWLVLAIFVEIGN